MVSILNTNNLNLKFTCEYSAQSVKFLDLSIAIDRTGNVTTDFYRKETAANNILRASSAHPKHLVSSIPYGEYLRARRNCTLDSDFEQEAANIRTRLNARGYNSRILRRAYKKAKARSRQDLLYKPKASRQNTPLAMISTYTEHHAEIKAILTRHWHILKNDQNLAPLIPRTPSFVYRRTKNLRDRLVHSHFNATPKKQCCTTVGTYQCQSCTMCKFILTTKTLTIGSRPPVKLKHYVNCKSSHVIYALICPCQRFYIGKTNRQLKTRIYEHTYDIRTGNLKTPIGRHFSICHNKNPEGLKVVGLDRIHDDFKICSKEKIFWVQPFVKEEYELLQTIADKKSLMSKALMKPYNKVRCLRVQKIRYVWDPIEKMFEKIGILEDKYSCSDIHTNFGSGFALEEQEFRKQVCGLNIIDVEVTPIWKLLFKEVFNPFYVFQALSLSLWFATGYNEYAAVLVCITLLSIAATIYNLRMQSVKLHKMVASHDHTMVTVLRKNRDIEEIESQNLVPGDVIVLTGKRFYLPCDSILLTGSCVVNEGMLTGESVPVTKMPLPNIDNSVPWKEHSGEDYKRHILFCGTEVIQAQSGYNNLVKAVVLRTGFNTAKGDLVRSILYPKPVNFKLHRDAIRFLMGLVALSLVAVIYTAIVKTGNNDSTTDVVVWCFIMITVCIPASLPSGLTLCILYAQTRLQWNGIFCLSAQRINMCGQLNIICFDKTGTLTEDGMEPWGVIPSQEACFQEAHLFTPGSNLSWGPLLGAMISCHSLILLDGKVTGDPLDLKMFEETGWMLEDSRAEAMQDEASTPYVTIKPGPAAVKVPVEGMVILHQYPFSSSLQRMSVIAQVIGGDNEQLVFMKGAPEMVVQFCKQETVPLSFRNELELYTSQGFRVIALAYKMIEANDYNDLQCLEREGVESDLAFLGLLILENKLKPETKPVLQELRAAKIRTVMITGDNLETACAVGKSSGLIPYCSNTIVIQAKAPEGDCPASLTWETPKGHVENQKTNEESINMCYPDDKAKDVHFAMNGKTYQVIVNHFYTLLPKILINGTIFARMSPGQKSSLIEEFQKIDYYAGMCGDGANDCGALKVAHAGISLSELEASVASPFTSKKSNIECVPALIKEGRNCLVTSFCIFKYIAMYAMIELICLMLLFWTRMLLGTRHYLMQDVAITITVILTISLTGPATKLAPYRPSGQLISPPLLLSIVLHCIFTLVVQTVAFTMVQQQPWYDGQNVLSACLPLNHTAENLTLNETELLNRNFGTTTLWFVSGINLIIVEVVLSKGRPFRKPLYTNYIFATLIIAQIGAYFFIFFADIESVYINMQLVCTPYYWRWDMVIMMAVLLVVSYLAEEGFIENRRLWLLLKKWGHYQSKSQYRVLERTVRNDPKWPPVNETIYSDQAVCDAPVHTEAYNNPAFDGATEIQADCNGIGNCAV
ncbi:putative cation-transporting ATPase 13A4 [Gastrophryne carolinensis]